MKLILLFAFILSIFTQIPKAQVFPLDIKIEPVEKERDGSIIVGWQDPIEIPPRLNIDSCNHHQSPKKCSDEALLKFIYSNLNVDSNESEGIVVISFTVDEEGEILEEKVIRNLNSKHDDKAMLVFKKLKLEYGKWIPGSINGKNVKTKYNLPFRFRK